MEESTPGALAACPRCGATTTKQVLAETAYLCPRCSFEVAYVDLTPTGSIRGLMGWVKTPGEVLQGRYRIVMVLGRGGFATTYLVEDLSLKGKRRALKEIPQPLYDETETELLSKLRHPAIPDIIDRFEAEGMVYLVLEFGGARTLESERQANRGTVSVDRLDHWMRQLCDVLSYLHSQDPPIVHRDLKPANILLDDGDRVMLIDFGIAKESGEWAVTRTIARSASHGFSPPEQAMGTGTDERSDVYALGATMYTLVTGTVPPAAHERVAGRELRAPRELNPNIPVSLERAILEALDLNVNRRQQSISELSRVFAGTTEPPASVASEPLEERTERLPLDRVAAATGFQEREVPAPTAVHHKIWVLGALMLVVSAAIGTGVALYWNRRVPPPKRTGEVKARRPATSAVSQQVASANPEPTASAQAPEVKQLQQERLKLEEERKRTEQMLKEMEAQRKEAARRKEQARRVRLEREKRVAEEKRRAEEQQRKLAQVSPLMEQAEALFRRRRFEESVTILTRVLALDPNNRQARLHRGEARLAQHQPSEALTDFTRFIKLARDASERSVGYTKRGYAYARLNRDSDAIADYSRAIEAVPTNATAYYNRGMTYRRQRMRFQARSDLQRACELGDQDGCRAVRGGLLGSLLDGLRDGLQEGLQDRHR